MFDAGDVYHSLHVALRKACDSKPTSALWNAIYLLKEGEYAKFAEQVYQEIKDIKHHPVPEKVLANRVKHIALNMDYTGNHSQSLLYCLHLLMDDNDWIGYTSYLHQWLEEEPE